MAPGYAELIFVAGCQEGQRSVVMSNMAVAGRAQFADVQLREEYISREQFRLTYTTDGWVVENLSGNAIRINDKKYKRGKKVIVETGDVVGVGVETEILFVAQDDDAEDALVAYRATHAAVERAGAAEAGPAPAPAEAEGEQVEMPPTEGAIPEQPEEAPAVELEAVQGEESAEAVQRKAKLKKYGVMFGVYLSLLVAIAFVVNWLRGDSGPQAAQLVYLTEQQIEDFLKAEIKGKVLDTRAAETALQDARAMYQDAAVRDGNLYRCIKYFKLHLAYQRAPFKNVEDANLYDQAMDELVQKVQSKYDDAVLFEKNKQWEEARRLFDQLHRIIAAKIDPEPEEENLIFDNVTRHLVYVKSRANEGKEKSDRPF